MWGTNQVPYNLLNVIPDHCNGQVLVVWSRGKDSGRKSDNVVRMCNWQVTEREANQKRVYNYSSSRVQRPKDNYIYAGQRRLETV